MNDAPKSVNVWRITRPELYLANCSGLLDPRARQGHYLGHHDEPMGLFEAVAQAAADFPNDRYFDAQAWEGPDEDRYTVYHLKSDGCDASGTAIITMLRRSVHSGGLWEPASQISWPTFLHVEPQEA